MTTWGFIGSGNIGSTVAKLAVLAGHDVVMSNSRGPETLSDLVAELGPRARAATAEEAAAAGDLVVVTIPLKNYTDVPVDALRGKVVIDTMNYYPQRDGQVAELDDESTTTSELLQAHLPESKVVKAFNNIFFGHLATLGRTEGDPLRSALAIAGDDTDAKQAVTDASTPSATTPSTSGPSRRAGAPSATPRHTGRCMPPTPPTGRWGQSPACGRREGASRRSRSATATALRPPARTAGTGRSAADALDS